MSKPVLAQHGSNSLTEGPIARGIIFFALPLLLSSIFQQLYNSIDAAVVGQYVGASALAAVGSTGSLINLLVGFFLGLSTGTGVLFAMHYGAGDHPGLKKIIDCSTLLSVAAGLFISVIGVVFCRPLLRFMHTPEDVLPLAVTYLRWFFTGTVANMVYNVGAAIIRAEGDSRRPLIYLVISGVANLILDLALVAGFRTGVAGAAIATVAAQLLSALLVVLRLTRMDPAYRLDLRHMHMDRLCTWDIVRISVPCGLQGSMFSISNLLVQIEINDFGTAAMAGVAAYSKIDAFSYIPVNALGLATSTFVGQNVGAGQYQRIRKGLRLGMALAIGLALLVAGVIVLFCKPLLALFTDDAASQAVGLQMMWYLAPFAWLLAFMDVLGGAIRGAGQATAVTVITALSICVFRVVWLLVMLHFIQDLRIVFLCYPLSWVLTAVATILFYYRGSALHRSINAGES